MIPGYRAIYHANMHRPGLAHRERPIYHNPAHIDASTRNLPLHIWVTASALHAEMITFYFCLIFYFNHFYPRNRSLWRLRDSLRGGHDHALTVNLAERFFLAPFMLTLLWHLLLF